MNTKTIVTRWHSFLAVALFVLILVACGGNEPQTVSFMVSGDPEQFAVYEEMVNSFQQTHPDITIQLRHIPSDSEYRRQLAIDFSTGSPPDVMLLNYRRFPPFAAAGGLEPLGPYLAQSKLIQPANFYDTALAGFEMDGQLWCIPQNVSSLVVYYNKSLFDAAGVPYPAAGWTLADFLAAAQALTQDQNGDGTIDQYGVGMEPTIIRLAPFIWQNGGDVVDNAENPTRLTLDTPEALAAFQWFVDLQVKEKVVPDAVAEEAESSESRFMNGRLAMIFDSRRATPTFRTITGFEWDIAPIPSNGSPVNILHSDAYCMSAQAANKDITWTFIEYAISAAGQQLLAELGRTVPSLQSIAVSPAFLTPGQLPASSQVFLDNIPNLRHVPITPSWINIEEAVSREIERAFYGQATVEEVIQSANELTKEFFNR